MNVSVERAGARHEERHCAEGDGPYEMRQGAPLSDTLAGGLFFVGHGNGGRHGKRPKAPKFLFMGQDQKERRNDRSCN